MSIDIIEGLMKRISLRKVQEELDELEAIRAKLSEEQYKQAKSILDGFKLIGEENEPNPDGMKPGILTSLKKQWGISD